VRAFIETVVMVSRAILGDTRVRRQWMFLGTLLVMAFVFGGYFLASGFLRAHPMVFALYILASLAGVLFLVLFAVYDMLMIRREFLEARRVAREEMVREMRGERREADDGR
jgi:flagellar biosynthesis protein FlhB